VEIVLRKVGASTASRPAAVLEDTYWKLLNMGDMPVTVTDVKHELHMILQSEQKRVAGFGGCNRMMGGYKLEGDKISFSQLAGTMMACAQGMETESAFHALLAKVSRWKIAGDRLELFDAAGTSLAQFESQ
jgi:heat shock protein HslJ